MDYKGFIISDYFFPVQPFLELMFTPEPLGFTYY